ncbi:MAG: gamma carbonic anhydrase family protein, partial [Gammaproteobacteria bacterium]|nr:gamma carbonic anhydrase family protein [Gammaproteobacteria bacterium]
MQLKNIQTFQNKTPQIAGSAYVHESATVIGEVSIGENSSVWPSAVIRGDVNFIRIGKNTNIQDLSMLHV